MAQVNIERGSALLVLVGAGASFDCLSLADQRNLDWQSQVPPLTKDLARRTDVSRKLNLQYPDATPILNELRHRLLDRPLSTTGTEPIAFTLEEALADYLGRRSYDDRNVPRHIMATRFFLRDLIWNATRYVEQITGGDTNYTALVRTCYQWASEHGRHVCFVNFNYDPLLEFACRNHFRLQPASPDHYVVDPTAALVKPHGSVLWQWAHPAFLDRVQGAAGPNHSIDAGEPENIENDWAIHGSSVPSSHVRVKIVDKYDSNVSIIPALALPVANKAQFVWPQSHQDYFTSLTRGSFGRVVAIGWRAAEAHFLPLLRPLVAPVDALRMLVVTGGAPNTEDAQVDAEETTERLLSAIEGCQSHDVSTDGFHSIFGNGALDWLLDD